MGRDPRSRAKDSPFHDPSTHIAYSDCKLQTQIETISEVWNRFIRSLPCFVQGVIYLLRLGVLFFLNVSWSKDGRRTIERGPKILLSHPFRKFGTELNNGNLSLMRMNGHLVVGAVALLIFKFNTICDRFSILEKVQLLLRGKETLSRNPRHINLSQVCR